MGFVSTKWEEETVLRKEEAHQLNFSSICTHREVPQLAAKLLTASILTHLRAEDISWIYQNGEARSFDTKILNKQKD